MATHRTKKPSRVRRHVSKHGIAKTAQQSSHNKHQGVDVYTFEVHDGYHQPWYRLERFGSRLFANKLEAYLAKRQHVDFKHPKNQARKILYALPSFPEWATLMPGALALEPVQDPEHRKLPTGKYLDPITRRMFRHSLDPVGVRTRTLMGGWLADQYVKERKGQPIHWLSLAGGTAAPSMLMVHASGADRSKLHYGNVDMDKNAIKIAREITKYEDLRPDHTVLLVGDIFDKGLLSKAAAGQKVDVIDMMGIFEYLDEAKAAELLKLAYSLLKSGGIIIAGNMRAEHKHLNLHKRGVGWPDVIPRSLDEVMVVCHRAGIDTKKSLAVYQPKDGVYNVLRIRKT